MTLHENPLLFKEAIRAASQELQILPEFIEKDYWITYVLERLSKSEYYSQVVFKGGTSLSKCYKLINRFSEDIDLAVVNPSDIGGSQGKTLIRNIEKIATLGLQEITIPDITSKGSKFRKSIYTYNTLLSMNISNRIIIEINTFANPYPYQELSVTSLLYDYMNERANDLIIQYGFSQFNINVLSKMQTFIEKIVSLIRFSFDKDPVTALSSKIRHFYDLHYLLQDIDCLQYLESYDFTIDFIKTLESDKITFSVPSGWNDKTVNSSILVKELDAIWFKLKDIYRKELSALSFRAIPLESEVLKSTKLIFERISGI